MNRLTATLVFGFIALGAVAATLLGWKYRARTEPNSTEPRWRSVVTVLALVLVTLSVLTFVAYITRNALIGGDRNGGLATLLFIRTGNYLSLSGAIAGLAGRGKTRWLVFIGGSLMLFMWFSEGMSL